VPVDVLEADLPIFDAAAGLGVPIYIHSGPQLQQLRDIAYSGFDRWTSMILGTGGWRWHAEAGLATLTRILAGTFDRHPDLQIILGHWGEMLVAFADRADLLRGVATRLERRMLDYITGNRSLTRFPRHQTLRQTRGGSHAQLLRRYARPQRSMTQRPRTYLDRYIVIGASSRGRAAGLVGADCGHRYTERCTAHCMPSATPCAATALMPRSGPLGMARPLFPAPAEVLSAPGVHRRAGCARARGPRSDHRRRKSSRPGIFGRSVVGEPRRPVDGIVEEFRNAKTSDDLQDVGRRCREVLIDAAKLIADPILVPSGQEPPKAGDAKAWLELFLKARAARSSHRELRAFIPVTWDLAQKVTHGDVDRVDAYAAAQATVLIVRTLGQVVDQPEA